MEAPPKIRAKHRVALLTAETFSGGGAGRCNGAALSSERERGRIANLLRERRLDCSLASLKGTTFIVQAVRSVHGNH